MRRQQRTHLNFCNPTACMDRYILEANLPSISEAFVPRHPLGGKLWLAPVYCHQGVWEATQQVERLDLLTALWWPIQTEQLFSRCVALLLLWRFESVQTSKQCMPQAVYAFLRAAREDMISVYQWYELSVTSVVLSKIPPSTLLI